MEKADTLINAKWVVPVEPRGAVLERHSVAVREGKIAAVLPSAEAKSRYDAGRIVDLPSHALIPGLVNLHTHSAMTLMRGLADDLPLMTWLKDHIWPAEAKHVSPEFVHDGTLLACAEMLRGGITCFNDMYFFPEASARAALACGLRAAIGMICLEFPTPYASDPDDYLAKGLATRDTFRGEPLLSFTMAPHAPYTVSDASFARIVTLAEELDLPIHLHLHETDEEIRGSVSQHGARPLARLDALGVVGPRLIAVHAVHLEEREIGLLARKGASVAHCPGSNLKLASGFAPTAALLDAGVNVGLGTDGAASNNRLDLFAEMRAAALLAKAVSGRADALPAADALAAATLNGARALGLDALTGSIVPGKSADLCAVDFDSPEMLPCYDPLSHLVYVAGREQVSHVWIQGRLRLDDKQFMDLDAAGLDLKIRLWQNRLVLDTKNSF
jgi:5-methylthioadenosine/S-adenosylhomocysteine deaminase